MESDEWRKSPVEYRLEYALVKVCVYMHVEDQFKTIELFLIIRTI